MHSLRSGSKIGEDASQTSLFRVKGNSRSLLAGYDNSICCAIFH